MKQIWARGPRLGLFECQDTTIAGSLDHDFLKENLFYDALRLVVIPQSCSQFLNLCDRLGRRAVQELRNEDSMRDGIVAAPRLTLIGSRPR